MSNASCIKCSTCVENCSAGILTLANEKVGCVLDSKIEIEEFYVNIICLRIIDLFDSYYSVDSVKKYKPFNDIYEHVAHEENIFPNDIVMVATHDWDLFGAKNQALQQHILGVKKQFLIHIILNQI